MEIKVKVKHGYKRINKIVDNLPKISKEITNEILKNIRGYAIRLEKGHNEQGILFELVDISTNEVKGRVYTDKVAMPWAMFEHFGTGDYRELEKVGTTQHFLDTGGSQWFIPVSKVEKPLNYPIIEIQGSEFYIAHGVKANHFMTDAEFQSRNENMEEAKKNILKLFKEACK